MGVIDTGVDYTNPLFRYSDGSSRILRIWDQTIQDGTPPEGILYGAEYRKEEIDKALQKSSRMMWCRPAMKTGTGRS